MRTNEQRLEQINRRTEQIRQSQHQKTAGIQSGLLIAASLALVVALGVLFPKNVIPLETEAPVAFGAASMLSGNGAIGYVVMGLVSFLLGVTVTILLYRLHRYHTTKKQKEPFDEL